MYDPSKPYKKEILKLIESTWNTPFVTVRRGLYPTFTRTFDLPEVQHTDGIGTKGVLHWKYRTFDSAVIDALAMNLNDLAMVGATAYTLQNHIVLPKDDHLAILEIVRTLVRECKKRKIAMTGGETSIHEGMGAMDLSITVSGFVKKPCVNQCTVGDVLVGLKSSGLHSNGITKARTVLKRLLRKDATVPTRIYTETLDTIRSRYAVHGMMHITGGAFTKLKDIANGVDLHIDHSKLLNPQKIFQDIYRKGVSSKTMYSTFNCGVGFVLSMPETDARKVIARFKDAALIGSVVKGNGHVHVVSAFDGRSITL